MNTLVPSFLIGSSLYLQVTRTFITSRTSSQIGPRTAELAALEHLEKSPKTYNGRNLVNTLAPSFLIRSSSFLQVFLASSFLQVTMHESLDEFKFRQDITTNSRVICPCASEN